MKETEILSKLRGMNATNSKYIIENIFVFDSEMDLFVQNPNDYIIEYEVKCSIKDFKKDFKKAKHDWMHQVFYFYGGCYNTKCPNKFYFVCPENLIPVETIPKYAGLIYVSNLGTKIIKKAPFIHKEKLSVEKQLFQKLYWRWINEKRKNI